MGANLKEVRERITSVDSTMQITKAMKMVSAAKLRRAQEAISELRPYAVKLQEILSNILSSHGDEADVPFGKNREVDNACLVEVTYSIGVRDAYNSNILREAATFIKVNKEWVAKGGLVLLPLVQKSSDFLSTR